MQGTLEERARAMLSDYLYELETGDRRRGTSYGQDRSIARAAAPAEEETPTAFDVAAEAAALEWENAQIRAWRKAGRITADGHLRVGSAPLEPYTLEVIREMWPLLNEFDRLAALVDLDGVVEEGYMDAHENIRQVVKTIARDELADALAAPEVEARIADIVFAQVGVVFGSLLEKLRVPAPRALSKRGGRQNRCSKCHIAGHRATTCTATPEEIRATLEAQKRERAAAAAKDGAAS